MIDFKTVVVRPKISSTDEDPVGKALAKHGMSKFAGCPDVYMGASYDRTLGRYLTGLDENHPDILNLPQDERLAKQKEILEERAYLERELGVNLHHTNEDYWSTIQIVLDRGKLYNPSIPKDRVIIHAIKAGKIAPTDKSDIGNPDFIGTNFYVGSEYEDVADKNAGKAKERLLAVKVIEILDKFEYAIEICDYLNIPGVTERIPLANLDDILSTWLDKKTGNKELFLEAMKEKEEFVRLSNLFKKFKAKGLVRYEDGTWVSGKVKLGKTEKLAVKKLLTANPDMQAELAKLMEDYEETKK